MKVDMLLNTQTKLNQSSCFNEDGAIFLLDQFMYLGSNISSIENYVNICVSKTWSTIDRLTTLWKSDLCDKVKYFF